MNIKRLWFDRLRNHLRELESRAESGVIPGLLEDEIAACKRLLAELNEAQPLIISADVSRRIAPNGEPSEDLKQSFRPPFDPVFFEFETALRLPGMRDEAIRGMLVLRQPDGNSYRCHVWVQRQRKVRALPAMSFEFIPSIGRISGAEGAAAEPRQVMNFLIWLSGYINSPNVLAIRHNRRYDLVRSYERRGMLPPSSYYTFEPERLPSASAKRLAGKAPTVDVHGYFRRAHWHRLATGGSAWFHTSWVRPYRRRTPATDHPLRNAA